MSSPFHPLLLLLLCALLLSGFDLLRKVLVRRLSPVVIVLALAWSSVPLFAAAAAFEMRPIQSGYLAPAVASILLNLVAHLAFVQAIRVAHLSTTVPLLSLTPVFTSLVGLVLLDEHPTAVGWLGITLVVLGAFLLHWTRPPRHPAGDPRHHQPTAKERLQGSILMVLTALCWSWTLPLDKLAVARSGPAFHGLTLCLGIGLGALAILVFRSEMASVGKLRRVPGLFALSLLTSTLALALQLVVLETLMVSLVETVKRGVGNLAAMLLGRWFLGESLDPGKLLAGGAMAVGVALILS